uniref:50S ribosomal protein L29 n=1 Tax=Microzonia abyssicola TaxID=217214 RepID=UPI002E761B19|nr:50S ribosomal protein L29 [Syringoderma abyssicola]WAM64978.1 50S ribosomal protein L29 [Syringoderma abyssicola]
MSLPKIGEIKTLTHNDLENEILSIKKQLFKLRLYRGTKQSFKSHQFKHGKHRLAQLLMVQKQLEFFNKE